VTKPTLKRSLSLPLTTFYGLGTIIGAGIYVLIGEVAARAGSFTPIAFALAAVIAGFTAFTYAELSARHPRSASEAVYVNEAFGFRLLSAIVGYGVVFIGIVSAATISRGFAGYFDLFLEVPHVLVIGVLVLSLGSLAASGIDEAVWFATLITLIEIAGLIFVVVVAGDSVLDLPERGVPLIPSADPISWTGIGAGAFLAFYAFVGFEDMVNIAEEVREPERTLPRAIILALTCSTALYVMVAITAVAAVPITELAGNEAPLAAIVSAHGVNPKIIGLIGLMAVVNGALIQFIMASRVLFGMANLGTAPKCFGVVCARTRTPVNSTLVVTLAVLGFASFLPLVQLASLTSLVTLMIFALVNGALWRLKISRPAPIGIVSYPLFVPVTGLFLCLILIAVQSL
jgi:amino acid transporter